MILAILSALTVPKFKKQYDYFHIKSEIDQLMAICVYTKNMSILKENIFKIQFNPDKNSYQISEKNLDWQSSDPEQEKWSPLEGRVGKIHKISQNHQLQLDENIIFFYPEGTSSEFHAIWTRNKEYVFRLEMIPETAELIIRQ